MQETLTGLQESGYWIFGALAAVILLADLIVLAVGRRMLNPRRLTDRVYRRLKRRLIREGLLDKDATYEPRVVGTLVGHIRAIQGWSVTMGAVVGVVFTVAALTAPFLIEVPVAAGTEALGFRLALGSWLALGSFGFSLLLGSSIGYTVATRRVARLPPDIDTPTTTAVEGVRPRRRWIPRLLLCNVIAADAVVTLIFGRLVADAPAGVGTGIVIWLTRFMLVAPPLMVLALVLGELLAHWAARRRPLLLTPDVELARHANGRLREEWEWTYRGFTAVSVGSFALAQYGVIAMLILVWAPTPSNLTFVVGFEFAYLFLSIFCSATGGIARTVGTHSAQAQAQAQVQTAEPSSRRVRRATR